MECCACGADPLKDPSIILWRVNRKGINAVMLCDSCYASKDHDESIQCAVYCANKKAEQEAIQ